MVSLKFRAIGIFFILMISASALGDDLSLKKAIHLGSIYNESKSKAGDVDISSEQTIYISLPLPSDWKIKNIFHEKNDLIKDIQDDHKNGKITQADEDKKRSEIKAIPNEMAIQKSEQNKSLKYYSQYIITPQVLISKNSKNNKETIQKIINILKFENSSRFQISFFKNVEVEKQAQKIKFTFYKATENKKYYLFIVTDPLSSIITHNESQSSDNEISPFVLIAAADSESSLEWLLSSFEVKFNELKFIDSESLNFTSEREWKEFNSYMDCDDLNSRSDYENCNLALNKYTKNQIDKSDNIRVAVKPEVKKGLNDLNVTYNQFIKLEKERIRWDQINAAITENIVSESISEIKRSHQQFLKDVLNKKLLLTASSDEVTSFQEKLKLAVINKQAEHTENFKNVELEGDIEKTDAAKKKKDAQIKSLNESQVAWTKYFNDFIKLGKLAYSDKSKSVQVQNAIKVSLIKTRLSQLRITE